MFDSAHKIFATQLSISDVVLYQSELLNGNIHQKAYEPDVTPFFLKEAKLKNNKVFLDVGANIGYYTVLGAKYFNEVIAVEPFPSIVKALRYNIQINNVAHKVDIIEKGASDKIESIAMVKEATQPNAKCLVETSFEPTKRFVNLLPLDLMVGSKRIDIIKIDIEGFETKAIRGLQKTIKTCKPTLIIEVNPVALLEAESSTNELLELLECVGYSKFRCIPHFHSALSEKFVHDAQSIRDFIENQTNTMRLKSPAHINLVCKF